MTTGLISPTTMVIIISFLTFLTVFFLIYTLVSVFGKERAIVRQRLSTYFPGKEHIFSKKEEKKRLDKKRAKLNFKVVDAIRSQLAIAGIIMKPEEFLTLWIVCSFVPSGFLALVFGNPISTITLAVLGAAVPPFLVYTKKKKRIILFENQLSDALTIISNCLKSGLTFQKAIENISNEMPEPISREFGLVIREIRYGSTMDKALNNMVTRIKSKDLELMVSTVLIQRQVGGNLSEILDNISETIKGRLKLKNEIRVLTATGRMSGVVIGSLPLAIGVILLLVNPAYINSFFESSLGITLLYVAGGLEIIGFLVVKKIVTIKY